MCSARRARARRRWGRIAQREHARYGARVEPGGPYHAKYTELVRWAARYDEGDLTVRSRALHEAWIATLPCAVVRLEGEQSDAERVARVLATLERG